MDDADSAADQENYIWSQMAEDITCGPILGTQAMSFCAARRQGYERFHV